MTKMPKTFYRYEEHRDYWAWACVAVDRSFAVHIWARMGTDGYFGGVEEHRLPREGEESDHSLCPFLDGPCCHEGSALEFNEYKSDLAESIKERTPYRVLGIASGVFKRRWNYHNAKDGE